MSKSVVSLILALTFISTVCYADNIQQKQNQLNKINGELQQKQNEINNAQTKITGIDTERQKVQKQRDALAAELKESEENIKKWEISYQKSVEEMNENKELVKKRMRVMYEKGSVNYLNVIFSANSFEEMLSKYELVRNISKFDKEIMLKYKDAANRKKIAVDQKKEEEVRKKNVQRLLAMKDSDLAKQKDTIADDIADVKEDKADLEKDRQKLQKEIAQEKADALRAQQLALQGQKNSKVVYVGGNYSWPTGSPANVTSAFGLRMHPIFRVMKYHSGIDIAVGTGTPVVAAIDGVVTKAGWESGYGKTVMLDHGKRNGIGISSLYGHNSSLAVSAGQSVKKGQVIAYVGSTGNSTGPHLHFEILENGRQVNPFNYYNSAP